MRARLTFCTIFAIGALLTMGAGAAFAQTGIDNSNSAGQQQYGEQTPRPGTDVLGEVGQVEGNQAPAPGQNAPEAAAAASAPQAAGAASAPKAAAAGVPRNEGELPFTGFAVVLTLLLGLGLLGAGLVVRRSTREGTQH